MELTSNLSVWQLFFEASAFVKLVMLVLFAASILSWTIIFRYINIIRQTRQSLDAFTRQFWSGGELSQLFKKVGNKSSRQGLANVFYSGFQEYLHIARTQPELQEQQFANIHKATQVAINREQKRLEAQLPWLATIGSTTPYIGLLGTVWGIMNAFNALGGVQQVTIAMVAPGIAEALIATAMGLFAAIPAVIAYNYYSNQAENILAEYDNFSDEFTNLLQRRLTHMEQAYDA